jgi:hypothetical protein
MASTRKSQRATPATCSRPGPAPGERAIRWQSRSFASAAAALERALTRANAPGRRHTSDIGALEAARAALMDESLLLDGVMRTVARRRRRRSGSDGAGGLGSRISLTHAVVSRPVGITVAA